METCNSNTHIWIDNMHDSHYQVCSKCFIIKLSENNNEFMQSPFIASLPREINSKGIHHMLALSELGEHFHSGSKGNKINKIDNEFRLAYAINDFIYPI